MSKSREQLNAWLSRINIQGLRVLDVGCGPRDKWALNYVHGDPKRYITVDGEEFPGVLYQCDLEDPDTYVDEPFDIVQSKDGYERIFFLETLEHVYDAPMIFKELYRALTKGGVLYFSTPLINPIHDDHDFCRWTNEGLTTLLEQCGFDTIEIFPRVATVGKAYLEQFFKAEGMRMSKLRLKRGESSDRLFEIGYMGSAVKMREF